MTHPPEIDKDLEKMISKGIPVHVVQEDAKERGLSDAELPGTTKVSRRNTSRCGTGDLTLIEPSHLS